MKVQATIRIHASAEAIWQAWATPEGLVRWYVDGSEGHGETGGTLTWAWDAFGFEIPLDVELAEPPARLVLTADNGARVEVRIEEAGPGACDVTVVQDGGLPEDPGGACIVEGCRSGWRLALASLDLACARHPDAEQRRHWFGMRPLPAGRTVSALQGFFTFADPLALWLGHGKGIGGEGDSVKIRLPNGSYLRGRVHCRTATEVMITWDGRAGALTLKAFHMTPEEAAFGLDLSMWGPAQAGDGDVAALLDSCLDSLAEALAADADEPAAKPPIVVNVEDTPWEGGLDEDNDHWGGFWKVLTPGMFSRGGKLGVNQSRLPPGRIGCPFHAHQLEDEVFYIQSGTGLFRYGDELFDVKAGDCISCPAGTGVAHQLLNTGDEDLIYLGIGDNRSQEVGTYPDNGKVLIRGIGRIGHITDAPYMDGEPDPPIIKRLAEERSRSESG